MPNPVNLYRFRRREGRAWVECNGIFATALPKPPPEYPHVVTVERGKLDVRVTGGAWASPLDFGVSTVYLAPAGLPEVSAAPAVLDVVREAVRATIKKVWRADRTAAQLGELVHPPTRGSAVAVLHTEHAYVSQYDNDRFWMALQKALDKAGLYYEWIDGGTAHIYRD